MIFLKTQLLLYLKLDSLYTYRGDRMTPSALRVIIEDP